MRLMPIFCLVGVIAACTIMNDMAPGTSPSAIRDAYLIAHGMAQGYSGEPQADPAVLAELARLDAEAGRFRPRRGRAHRLRRPSDDGRAIGEGRPAGLKLPHLPSQRELQSR
jgi:hypothetical protein